MLRHITTVCFLLIGCGSTLQLPARSGHTPEEFIEVPFPPPAARSDVVPQRLHPDSLWIDGEWHWQGAHWRWRRGAWVRPPAGATLARSETKWAGARVLHAASVFHLASGESLAPSELREHRHKFRHNAGCTASASASFGQRAMWPNTEAP